MDVTTVLIAAICALLAGFLAAFLGAKLSRSKDGTREIAAAKSEIIASQQSSVQAMVATLTQSQREVFAGQDKHIADLKETVLALSQQQENASGALRRSVSEELSRMRDDNDKKLGEIRASVDEKLQKTLEDRLQNSFKQVSERLEQVYKGLGEMQTLAVGVGDLKKVLTNVKTRGNLGEYQLGAILEQILAPEQYESNVATVPGSANRVEFAVRLPGAEEGKSVYLPIDSKFPMDAFFHLTEAQESGDEALLKTARQGFEGRIKQFAKDVSEKYLSPPYTTDFAILFLPTEGLYAEVIRCGLLESLQAKYRVNIAGPTTLAALLNSLQMGFRTLAIQKRSGEVWEVLGAVRTEFDKFETALRTTRTRLAQADSQLESLVGVRTRAINRKLREVATLPQEQARELLKVGEEELEEASSGEDEEL